MAEQAGTVQTIVAGLAAAFPNAKIGADHLRMYVKALQDIPPDELERAALAHVMDGRFFPTVRELRRLVMETRLGLPSPEQAWEQAERWSEGYVNTPPSIRCPNRDCYAGVVKGGEPQTFELPDGWADSVGSLPIREALEQMQANAQTATSICPTCEGEAEIRNPERQRLLAEPPHPAVRQALDHVGGPRALIETDVPEVIRSQFLKAYDRVANGEVRHANLDSAGLAELSGAQRGEIGRAGS